MKHPKGKAKPRRLPLTSADVIFAQAGPMLATLRALVHAHEAGDPDKLDKVVRLARAVIAPIDRAQATASPVGG